MNKENLDRLKMGTNIIGECLNECAVSRLELNIHGSSEKFIKYLLTRRYLKVSFNGNDPGCGILIFHDSKDTYSHNGSLRIICFLGLTPKILKYALRFKKVKAEVKRLQKRKEVINSEN